MIATRGHTASRRRSRSVILRYAGYDRGFRRFGLYFLLAGIPHWKFKPFVLGGKPVPVCSVVLLTYPSSNRPEKEVMPLPEALEGDDVLRQPDVQRARISGQKLNEPDLGTKRGMQRLGLRRRVVLFNVCIDATGRVVATTAIKSSGSASYDQVLM